MTTQNSIDPTQPVLPDDPSIATSGASQHNSEELATSHDEFPIETIPLLHRLANLVAILIPVVGVVLAMAWTWGYGFDVVQLSIFFAMYLLTGFGITIGYHRLFTHRSFDTSRVMRVILGIAGSMAVEGSVLSWVALHRRHHHHSDQDGDPHSPHTHGGGFFNIIRGIYWAHLGWILRRSNDCDLSKYVADLVSDRSVRVVSRLFFVWAFLGLALPALVGGLITMSWGGALLGFIWGGLVRIFFVHHATWSVNSICHIWGTTPFRSHDHSKNNPIVAVLALGEGWHNAHHAFPTSARHGLRWWEFDPSFMVIRILGMFRIVSNVKSPSSEHIRAKMV